MFGNLIIFFSSKFIELRLLIFYFIDSLQSLKKLMTIGCFYFYKLVTNSWVYAYDFQEFTNTISLIETNLSIICCSQLKGTSIILTGNKSSYALITKKGTL